MSRTETYRRWTQDEVEFLEENYDFMNAEAIADSLGRTPDSVWEKAGRVGLRKHAKRHARNDEGPWHCPSCNKNKEISEFNKSSDGHGSAYCSECTRRIQAEKRKARKK